MLVWAAIIHTASHLTCQSILSCCFTLLVLSTLHWPILQILIVQFILYQLERTEATPVGKRFLAPTPYPDATIPSITAQLNESYINPASYCKRAKLSASC